jgi:hypothetical protein
MWASIWAVVKNLGLTKHVGTGIAYLVGGWSSVWPLLRMYWHWVVIGVLGAVLVLHKFHADTVQADLTERLNAAELAAKDFDHAIGDAERALMDCKAVNEANTASYEAMRERAEAAEARVRELRIEIARDIEDINDEAWNFRGRDADCRRLDDPLPDWFDHWLRD